MQQLIVDLPQRSYPIFIGQNILQAPLIAEYIPGKQVCIVSNQTVAPLYLDKIKTCLSNFDVKQLILPDGEQFKTLSTFERILNFLSENNFHRDSCLIALGGGVIGDIIGFAAACYQRGIAYLQIPTSLLAQVDASVGGKTAVNLADAKNAVGAFHQPAAVFIDSSTLATLAERDYRAGFAEVIKYALIADQQFFAWIEENQIALLSRDPSALEYMIHRCCEIKAEIVAKDERDQAERQLLNLGHTFGHAIESVSGYEILHGEAVAIGIVKAAQVSQKRSSLSENEVKRIIQLLTAFSLPTTTQIATEKLLKAMEKDKKIDAGHKRLILLKRIGQAYREETHNE